MDKRSYAQSYRQILWYLPNISFFETGKIPFVVWSGSFQPSAPANQTLGTTSQQGLIVDMFAANLFFIIQTVKYSSSDELRRSLLLFVLDCSCALWTSHKPYGGLS